MDLDFLGPNLFVLAFFAFVLIALSRGVRTVPQGEQWTVERFGRYTRSLQPGLRLLIPLIDQVGHKVNMMETVLDIESQEVITRDNASVAADGVAGGGSGGAGMSGGSGGGGVSGGGEPGGSGGGIGSCVPQ